MLEEIKILIDNKNNIIENAITWQKNNYPERTKQYDKCSRDIGYIIDAYISDMSEKTANNIIDIASNFWINSVRQIISYETEFKVHDYIISYINNNLFKNEESKIFLTNLKEVLFSIIKTGPINTHYQDKIAEAVNGFQRCQRNFDLDRQLDSSLIELLYEIALTTPTKQNLVNFDVIAVANRQLIRKCAESARSEDLKFLQNIGKQIESGKRLQNPQVDCNLLFLYVMKDNRKTKTKKNRDRGPLIPLDAYNRLVECEIGISAGAVGLAANLLGLKTGCCKCYDESKLPDSVFKDNGYDPYNMCLMLGIGFPKFEKHTLHTDGINESDSYPKESQRRLIIS